MFPSHPTNGIAVSQVCDDGKKRGKERERRGKISIHNKMEVVAKDVASLIWEKWKAKVITTEKERDWNRKLDASLFARWMYLISVKRPFFQQLVNVDGLV